MSRAGSRPALSEPALEPEAARWIGWSRQRLIWLEHSEQSQSSAHEDWWLVEGIAFVAAGRVLQSYLRDLWFIGRAELEDGALRFERDGVGTERTPAAAVA